MSRTRSIAQGLFSSADFPGEILTGVPVVEIKGVSEAVILQHSGIIAYQKDAVKIASKLGMVVVTGENLEIFRMNRERIILHGKISRVEIGAQPC